MVQDIKIAFREFPEAVKKAVTDFVEFFTVDIPKKFNEIKFTSLLSHFFNDSDLKFKNSYVNEFLEKNKKEIKKFKRKEKILVELLVGHHTEVIVLNCLIAKDLSDYFNCNCDTFI